MAEWRNQTSIPKASNKRPSSSFLRRICSLGAALLVLALLPGPVRAEILQENTASAQRVLLADYGLYTADVSETLLVAADIALEKKTYRIPLQDGQLFGIRFVLLPEASAASGEKTGKGKETAGEMALAVRISYPAPAPPSVRRAAEAVADTGQMAEQNAGPEASPKNASKAGSDPTTAGLPEATQSYTHTRMLSPGQLCFEGLRIADTAPFLPGSYTFELLLDGKVQLSRGFELYREEAPQP